MMYGYRKDGVAVKLPLGIYETKEDAIRFAYKNEYLAVMLDNKYVFAGKDPFSKQVGNLRVLEIVPDNAALFTDTDERIKEIPFYFRGIFGINSKREVLTKLHTPEFTTALGNTFKIYLKGTDIVFLIGSSPKYLTMRDVMDDVIVLAAETHGLGKSVGLIITPTSTGYFNMKI